MTYPAPDALRNPPFLRNPEIASVQLGHGPFGPNLTMTLDKAAAAILARETERHHRNQMLIVLGERVLVAAIVMGRLGDAIVLDGFPEAELPALASRLRARHNGVTASDQSCTEPRCNADSCADKLPAPSRAKDPVGTLAPAA